MGCAAPLARRVDLIQVNFRDQLALPNDLLNGVVAMRPTVLAVALAAVLAAAPATAQQLGQPSAAPFPYNVDNFNVPMGQTAGLFGGIPPFWASEPMARLRQICEGRSTKDRMTCNRAWGEIKAAYVKLHPERAAPSARD